MTRPHPSITGPTIPPIPALCLFFLFAFPLPLHAQLSAAFSVDVDSGAVPLSVQFFDQSVPQDSIILREWDLDGDGITDSQESNPRYTYEIPGKYTVALIVADSSGRDTARYTGFVEVAPVPEAEIVCNIRVVEYSVPVAKYVELWGFEGSGVPAPIAPVSLRMPLDTNGCACFYRGKFLNVLTQNITDLLILDENFDVIGKTGFSYPLKDFMAQRRRDAIVIVHRDLVSYQDHPREQASIAQWIYPRYVRFPWLPDQPLAPLAATGDAVTGKLHQTSMLVPPQCCDSSAVGAAQFRLDNIRADRIPFVLLHGFGATDGAWGANSDIITPADTAAADFNGKRDYPFTSYTGRLQRHDRNHADRFDVWEYYYPPDQNWEESGYLFARDLAMLLGMYDTTVAAAAAQGMGGLVLRSYLEGTAENYTSFAATTGPAGYRGDLYKTVFLGTPHAGRLRAGLAYAAPDGAPVQNVMDRRAPALRELMPGGEALLRLDPSAMPSGVSVLNIAGSAPAVAPPLPVESEQHDDGRTALSSAMLPAPRTINAVLGGYAYHALQSPDDAGGDLDAPEADLIPELLYAFVLSDSTLAPYRSRFLDYSAPDTLRFSKDVYQPPFALPLHADVGLPVVQLLVPPGVPWPIDGRFRLKLHMSGGPRFLLQPFTSFAQLDDEGLYLYPSTMMFSSDPVASQAGTGETAFFPVSRAGAPHPLHSGMLQLSGYGWQLPPQQQTVLPDPLLARSDDFGRRFDLARAAGDLRLAWGRAKRSSFTLTGHEILLLDPSHPLRSVPSDPKALIRIETDCLTKALTFILDYSGCGEPALSLLTPSSGTIDPSMANDSTVFYTNNSHVKMKAITVMQPEEGSWLVLLDGVSAMPASCRAATIVDAARELHIALAPARPLSMEDATVTLRLDPGMPLTQINANLLLVDSAGTRTPLSLRDDGVAPDTAANDGIYAGRFSTPRAGTYRLEGVYAAQSTSCPILRTATMPLVLEPSLELLHPRGGESWQSNTVQRVRWQGERPTHVALDFSTNGGADWRTIADSLDASAGGWDWTIPDVTSEQCLLRVRDADDPARTDVTPDEFTVYEEPVIRVRAPDGGESWQVDTEQDIRWDVIAVPAIDLSYSTDSGRNWQPIASNVPAGTGSYAWRIPVTPSDSCLVRAVSHSASTVRDESNAVFRITPIPAVELIAPNGGERWQVGTVQRISWQSAAVDSVRIALSTDAGARWQVLTSEAAEAGEWFWTVPDRISDSCFVRVTAIGMPQLSDESDAPFSITPEPFLTLLAPVGGERWEIGTSEQIRWASAGITSVDIEYSTDNGRFWTTAAVNIDADQGRYLWAVPREPSEQCRVRVSDTYDSSRTMVSPQPFIISESLTRPTLFAPLNRAEGVSTRPIFRWGFTDAVVYHLQVTHDPLFGTLVIDEENVTTTNFQSPELLRETRYYWRVKATRSDMSESEWSSTWEFTTSGTTLAAPRHLKPLDGSIGLARGISITWAASENADAYHLQLAADENFSQLVLDRTGLTGRTHSIEGLEYASDYWWRLRAGNTGTTAFSDWSRAWKFSTAPAPPRQLTPLDGWPDLPLRPLLVWYPAPNARVYRLQVATDERFDTEDIIFDSSNIAGTTVQLPGLWSFWTYYWRLNVTTGRGTSNWNDPWMFRTVDIGTDVEDRPARPSSVRIDAAWPQPARSAVTIVYRLPAAEDVHIALYDLLGRRIRDYGVWRSDAGTVMRTLDISGIMNGTCVLRLTSPSGSAERMLLIR